MLARDAPRDEPVQDLAALVALADAFAAETGRALRLGEAPTRHPRGGYALHVWLSVGDEEAWVHYLHDHGWSAVY
ncbi:MAG TPA: hypothetical protein DEA08_01445 [Planctomycetes bacterium]|nr:hypothetical protein [Planctomycetota bacterium]